MNRNEKTFEILQGYDHQTVRTDLERWYKDGYWQDPPEWLTQLAEALHVGFSSQSVIVAACLYVMRQQATLLGA